MLPGSCSELSTEEREKIFRPVMVSNFAHRPLAMIGLIALAIFAVRSPGLPSSTHSTPTNLPPSSNMMDVPKGCCWTTVLTHFFWHGPRPQQGPNLYLGSWADYGIRLTLRIFPYQVRMLTQIACWYCTISSCVYEKSPATCDSSRISSPTREEGAWTRRPKILLSRSQEPILRR